MSLAEYLPKPPPVFSKLADILGNLRAVQFVVAKFAALLRGNEASVESPVSEYTTSEAPHVIRRIDDQESASVSSPLSNDAAVDPAIEAPAVARSMVEQAATVLEPARNLAIVGLRTIAEPQITEQAVREELIRQRWAETGSKLWNPDVHGAGNAALNIQGGVALLPPKPGGTLPRYDTLEFRTLRSRVDGQEVIRIVCEGVAVDPPQRRSRDGVRRAQ
jgi:hypothetical protein